MGALRGRTGESEAARQHVRGAASCLVADLAAVVGVILELPLPDVYEALPERVRDLLLLRLDHFRSRAPLGAHVQRTHSCNRRPATARAASASGGSSWPADWSA